MEKYSPDLLVKVLLEPNKVFDLSYELKLPKSLPNGVFILKFQMIDPYVSVYNLKNQNTDKQSKDEKFGEVMSVTIQVQDGNLGNLQSQVSQMPEALANMDFSNIEGDLEQDDYYEENGFDLQNASYFKNLKIGDYNLD